MKKGVIIFIVLTTIVISLYSYSYIKILPGIKEYGRVELERFNQLIVTHSYMSNESIYDRFVHIERNESGDIVLIEFDMIKINELANDVVLDIESTYADIETHSYTKKDDSHYENRMYEVSKKGIISKISMAALMNMPYFHPFFPAISVSYKHLSKVNSSIVKNVSNYGLNHIMVEIKINISMDHTIVYPFFERFETHSVDIPVLLEIYQGQIPLVYTN